KIVRINPAFTNITGFEEKDALGKNHRFSKSGRHDKAFYERMWRDIKEKDHWEGEIWDRKKNGEIYPKYLSINSIKNSFGKVEYYIGIFRDITQKKETEKRLHNLAFYDPLTNLPNRSFFHERMKHDIDVSERNRSMMALFFIDLDRFKQVNDTLGHASGDDLLVEISQRIKYTLRSSDTLSRLGGDEFTVVVMNLEHPEDAGTLAQKIIDVVEKPITLKDQEVFVGASIGIAVYPDDGNTIETLTKKADTAMYRAKESGRGIFRFYSEEMSVQNEKRLLLETMLRNAVSNEEFELYYQPKINLNSGKIIGSEALIRWVHPEKGIINPGDFIPLAEETNLILDISNWVIRAACKNQKEWQKSGREMLTVALNLSGKQFANTNLAEEILAIVLEHDLNPQYIELEITETVAMDDIEKTIEILRNLRKADFSLSIDDFGTGYSSLAYLKKMPITSLKVDQHFVRDIDVDADDLAIATTIISMGKNLNLKVVAEGIEKKEHYRLLKNRSCDLGQGYYFSQPLTYQEFIDLVDTNPTFSDK
ncbi:MAG: EAL domain-containing protein, partial [Nitrospinae bacterium]|nr:EAL domain-containing protein [Nitrospinota bacterium]